MPSPRRTIGTSCALAATAVTGTAGGAALAWSVRPGDARPDVCCTAMTTAPATTATTTQANAILPNLLTATASSRTAASGCGRLLRRPEPHPQPAEFRASSGQKPGTYSTAF